MNYLAHAYLSFNNPEILLGNLIADFLRGKQGAIYSEQIQKGIQIHQEIDNFTDHHPVNIQAKKIFQQSTGRYSASFLDIAYDHFLSTSKTFQPDTNLQIFAKNCYETLSENKQILPDRSKKLFEYMIAENWLYNYREKELIRKSFERLSIRAQYLNSDNNAYQDFLKRYADLESAFNDFFPDLKEHIASLK